MFLILQTIRFGSIGILFLVISGQVIASINDEYGATEIYPDYGEQKVVLEFYYDHPQKIATGLYWLRNLLKTLGDAPYDHAPDDLSIVVVIHGTEIVTLAKKNYNKYSEIVERMRYYAELGVEFKVCSLAAADYGYHAIDFPSFIDLIPSSITELAHWQLKGHALIIPRVQEKLFTLEEIR